MRKLLKVSALALLVCGVLMACQDDETIGEKVNFADSNSIQLVEITENNEIIPVTSTRNGAGSASNLALRFASEEDYQKAISNIKRMDDYGRLAFTDSLGLTSLQKLLSIADDELDEIDSLATSESDFKAKYAKYKAEYGKYFVFNDVDLEDASPYIPDGDMYASYLVGKNYSVVIGNDIKTIAYSDKMNKADEELFANPNENNNGVINTRALGSVSEDLWETNNFTDQYYADHNDYKVSFSIYREGVNEVYVRLASQKKGAFAWKRPKNQVFYLKTELSNFRLDWLGPLRVPTVHEYSAKGGKTTFRYGYFVGRQITGKAYVWTEHTVTKNSAGVVYEILSTSHACKVDITKN